MNRDQALELVESKVKNDRLIKHMIAVEAVMRALAEKLDEDVEKWGFVGLVHDLDYDETVKDPERHGIVGAGYLKELGIEDDVTYAVESHVGHVARLSRLDKALYATDPLTGLIVAAALMHPSKSLGEVTVDFIMKRFKERRFAAGADRDQIRSCEEFGVDLEDFVGTGLKAMQDISAELGL